MKRAPGRRMRWKLLVGSLLAATSGVVIVSELHKPRAVYSVSVSEFLKGAFPDQNVRVRGTLVHGTLCKITTGCGYRFKLRDSDQELSVEYQECAIPDAFRDLPGWDVRTTVEGERCHSCHYFEATRVLAQGPGKYEYNGPWSRPAAPLPLCKALPRM